MEFLFFWKILFQAYNFSYSSTSSSRDYQRFFLTSDFLAESRKANKNWRKRSLILQYSLDQKTSIILRATTLLALKIICSCNTAKNPFSIYIFFSVHISVLCQKICARKNIYTAPFNDAQDLNF